MSSNGTAADAGTGDLFDAAMDGTQNEMHSQLAAFESRELQQIERAIKLIRKGRYGSCEVCGAAIPIARLKALPYTTVCIECRQKQETTGAARETTPKTGKRSLNMKGPTATAS